MDYDHDAEREAVNRICGIIPPVEYPEGLFDLPQIDDPPELPEIAAPDLPDDLFTLPDFDRL